MITIVCVEECCVYKLTRWLSYMISFKYSSIPKIMSTNITSQKSQGKPERRRVLGIKVSQTGQMTEVCIYWPNNLNKPHTRNLLKLGQK